MSAKRSIVMAIYFHGTQNATFSNLQLVSINSPFSNQCKKIRDYVGSKMDFCWAPIVPPFEVLNDSMRPRNYNDWKGGYIDFYFTPVFDRCNPWVGPLYTGNTCVWNITLCECCNDAFLRGIILNFKNIFFIFNTFIHLFVFFIFGVFSVFEIFKFVEGRSQRDGTNLIQRIF